MKNRIAIVYDWIDTWGGVERVLLILHEMFPDAEFFTSYVNREKARWASDLKIHSSFMQKLPAFIKGNRLLSLPFYSYAFETFDFSGYGLVISVSSSFAKGVITKPQTTHIAYILTPTRYLWGQTHQYMSPIAGRFASPLLRSLKKWDRIAAQRPDHIAAISQTVADRCQKYYNRSAEVIFPPFDEPYWSHLKKEQLDEKDYYLLVSRLETYKKVDLAIEAFRHMPDKRLIIVGDGTQHSLLSKRAGENVKFVSNISDEKLAAYYSQAKALIMPQEEDFGYVSLEAQFFGCPVIAYRRGGATETIVENKTGFFFDEQTPASLTSAINKFDIITSTFRDGLKKRAESNIKHFSRTRFEQEFKQFIESRIGKPFTI